MMSPPMMAPGMDVKPPRITTAGLQRQLGQRELHAEFAAHTMPATSATNPATDQTMTQMRLSGMPTDCAA